jgi:hypothetical protein
MCFIHDLHLEIDIEDWLRMKIFDFIFPIVNFHKLWNIISAERYFPVLHMQVLLHINGKFTMGKMKSKIFILNQSSNNSGAGTADPSLALGVHPLFLV